MTVELQHLRINSVVGLHFLGDLVHCMEYGCVIPSVKDASDGRKTEVCMFPEGVHRNVAGHDEVFGATRAEHFFFWHREELCG